MVLRAPVNGAVPISSHLKTEVSTRFRYQLGSTHYPAVYTNQLKKHLSNQSSLYEKYERFLLGKGSHHLVPPNRHFLLSAKMNETQRRTLVSP